MPTLHTPGPWSYSKKLSASENPKGFVIWKENNQSADVWIADASPVCRYDGDPGDEGEANARLIAAAPKMLDELKFCASVMKEKGVDYSEKLAWQKAVEAVVSAGVSEPWGTVTAEDIENARASILNV